MSCRIGTNAVNILYRKHELHKTLLDHKGLTTGKASSLGSKLLHSGRRVEQQNYEQETISSHGGHQKVNREKGEKMKKV